ncbi:MAG: spore germination protein [Pelosinus sp.]|nr:spore germination protein [Pelosinus sp.]
MFDIIEKTFGKFVSTFIGILYMLINITLAVTMLNMFSELLKTFFNPHTPLIVILLSLVSVACLIISGEFLVFARTVQILTVIGIFNFLLSFIFAFPNYIHIEYVIPIFDTSWSGFIRGTLFMTGAASESLLLLMLIIKFIPQPQKHLLWVINGIIACALIFSLAILVIISMMSPELAKRIAFGGVNAAQLIQIGEFIRGLEVFIFGTYQFIAIGKTALYLYCTWTTAKKIFPGCNAKLMLVLAGLTILGAALWLNSYTKAYFLAVNLASYVLLPFSLFVLLLALWAGLKKQKTEV